MKLFKKKKYELSSDSEEEPNSPGIGFYQKHLSSIPNSIESQQQKSYVR
jgi:hypothetical protein